MVGTLLGEDMISAPLKGGGLYSRCGVTTRTKDTQKGLAKLLKDQQRLCTQAATLSMRVWAS